MPAVNRLELDRSLQGFVRLLDLTLDLERNRSDAQFRHRGGQFVYVFDENVFETFCDPNSTSATTGSFHAWNWFDPKAEAIPSWWSIIQSQNTMLASEYAIAGCLPGAEVPHLLHMTPWHRHELLTRVKEISAELQISARTTEAIDEFLRLFRFPETGVEVDTSAIKNESSWQRISLDAKAARAGAERERFMSTSLAAEYLVSGRLEIQLTQLRRLLRPPLLERVHSLHYSFDLSDSELRAIEIDARLWLQRFETYIKRYRHPGYRAPRSLWSDAQGLAMARYIATRRMPNTGKRLVLVTGDMLMFEVYRQWFVELTVEDEGYYEPFILRRFGQYAPVFNLYDSATDVGRSMPARQAMELFAKLQHSVEVALLPLNLSLLLLQQREASEPMSSRAREELAHVGARSPAELLDIFSNAIEGEDQLSDWALQQNKSVLELAEEWRELERIAIGFSTETVSRRAQSLLSEATHIDHQPSPTDQATVSKLAKKTSAALTDSLHLWRPFAHEVLVKALEHPPKNVSRVPRTVWYRDGKGNRIWEPLSTEAGIRNFLHAFSSEDNPRDLFARVAVACMRCNEWTEARRFAGITWDTIETSRHTRADIKLEGRFLCALTQRFAAGLLSGHLGVPRGHSAIIVNGSIRDLERQLSESRRILAHCLELCDQLAPLLDPDLNRARILSERAATNLFGAASYLCTRPASLARSDAAQELLREAGTDLAEAAELIESTLPADQKSKRKDYEAVYQQTLVNLAALAVLDGLSPNNRLTFINKEWMTKRREQEILKIAESSDHLPMIVRTELNVYAAVLKQQRPSIPLLGEDDDARLPIDTAIHREITELLGSNLE